MKSSLAELLLILAVIGGFVSIVVAFHYEALLFIQRSLSRLTGRHRLRIGVGVLMALLAHIIEACFFAVGYWLAVDKMQLGALRGAETATLLDFVYFSFVTYATVGYGDLVPVGALRFFANIEALTGLVLVAWTASFLYMEMERHWRDRKWH